MPRKIKRGKSAANGKVTARAVEIYRDALPLRENYRASLRCKCPDCSDLAKCSGCRKFVQLSIDLDAELGLKPWDTSPLWADDEASTRLREEIEQYTTERETDCE